jgi:hypothetical protein
MTKKGQVAMEYLMTYGWAILVLLAIVSAMFALGIFSPSKFVSEECNFQPDFTCSHFMLYKSGANTELQVTFHNGFGYPINITGINFTTHGIGVPDAKVWSYFMPSQGYMVLVGEEKNITKTFTGTTQPSVGSMETIDVGITYKNPNTGKDHVMSGRITARVEAG